MSYTGNLTYADEQELDVAHPDYVPLADRRRPAFRPDPAVITFARLDDGEWGIKGVGLVGGDVVTVTKKDGTTVERVVGEVVKTRDGYDYATIVQVPREVTVEVGVPTAQVPDGRYAVHNDDQSVNDIAFYEVENVTEGKWAGWTFVRQIVGPSERKLSQKQGRAILAKVTALGLRESLQLFGQNTEKCGVCNRNLTNKESREYGIGPDCRAKHGY